MRWPWVSRKRYERLERAVRRLEIEKEGLVNKMMGFETTAAGRVE